MKYSESRRTARGLARSLLLPLLLSLLAGCAGLSPSPPDSASLLRDDLFRASTVPADLDVLALSPAMRHFLEVEIAPQLRRQGKLHGFTAALENRMQLKLEYDSAATRTAAEAFAARSGNCLSLTLMTAAFARELGLPVIYRRVYADESVSRKDRIVFVSGHINIALEHPLFDATWNRPASRGVIVDFLPHEEVRGYRWREITEDTVRAMYLNNRAAEAMVAGDLDAAYGWARAAILRAPRFFEAYSTLAVLYLRRGAFDAAEATLRNVLDREPENVAALSNLAVALGRQARILEEREVLERLARIEPHRPYHFFDLGQAALARQDFTLAREHFNRELRRNPGNHEAHFGLALAEHGLRDAAAAAQQLVRARDATPDRRTRDLYAAKLDWLRAHLTQ